MRDEIHQLPLTFNNCHFHLDGDGEAAATGTGERGRPHLPSLANLISERISKKQHHWQDKPRPASQSSSFAVPSHSRESPRTSPSRMSMSELGRARKNLPQIPGAPYSVSSPLEKIRGSAPKHQTHHLVDDLSLTEPSNYILEGIEREKQVLATVHQELSDLSKDLKVRVWIPLKGLIHLSFCLGAKQQDSTRISKIGSTQKISRRGAASAG